MSAIDAEYWLNNPTPSTERRGCRKCRAEEHTPLEHLQLVIDWCISRISWGLVP